MCFYNDCNAKAIQSHSISKSSVLNNISKKGNVYTPSFRNDKPFMKPVGIETQASVFLGFCKNHDNELFCKLDTCDNEKFDIDFLRQLLIRSISREIVIRQNRIKYNQSIKEKLKDEFNKSKKDFFYEFNQTLNNDRISFIDFKSHLFDINTSEKEINEEISTDENFIEYLKFNFISKYQLNMVRVVEKTIPIAFSGIIDLMDEDSHFHLIIHCLPYKDFTLIVITYPKDNEEDVNLFFSQYNLNDDFDLLKTIELLAVRGTSNLFFNIDYWDSLNEKIRHKFLSDFIDFDMSNILNKINYTYLEWNYNNKQCIVD